MYLDQESVRSYKCVAFKGQCVLGNNTSVVCIKNRFQKEKVGGWRLVVPKKVNEKKTKEYFYEYTFFGTTNHQPPTTNLRFVCMKTMLEILFQSHTIGNGVPFVL